MANFNGVSPTYDHTLDPPEIEEEEVFEENPKTHSNLQGNHWKKFLSLSFKAKVFYLFKILVSKFSTYNQQYKIRKFLYKFYISRNRPLPEFLGKYYFLETNHDIAKAYKPKPYPGSMLIFRSPEIYLDPTLGWDNFVSGGIETYDISGKHKNRREIMNEPFIQITAQKLNSYLQEYDNQTPQFNLGK